MKNRILLLMLVIFPGVPGYSQEVLTWEDCVNKAAANHPDLLSAKENLSQARLSKTIATSGLYPQVSGSLGASTSKGDSGEWDSGYSLGLSARQLIFDGFGTLTGRAISIENLKSAQYDYQVTSSDIRLRLRNAFINLLKTQELLKITQDIAKSQKQSAEMVRLRYEGGQEHKGSLMTAQANVTRAEFEVAQTARQLKIAQRKLNKELGNRENLPIQVKGSFDSIELSTGPAPDFEELARTTPLLQQLIIRKDIAKLEMKSAKSAYYPGIYASASYGKSGSAWPLEDESMSAGASLSIPIFKGGQTAARVAQSKSALRQNELDTLSGIDQVILTLETSWNSLQDAIEQITVEKQFLEADTIRSQIADAEYSSGLLTFDNWIIIENNLVSSRKSYLNTKANALTAEADWIQAKGGTLEYEK